MWLVESEAACRGAKLRPSIMHLNSKSCISSSAAGTRQHNDGAHGGDGGSGYCMFLKHKRARVAGDEEGGAASGARGGGAGRAGGNEGCRWLQQGWSTRLELTQNWFSHNIPTWHRLFLAKVSLSRSPEHLSPPRHKNAQNSHFPTNTPTTIFLCAKKMFVFSATLVYYPLVVCAVLFCLPLPVLLRTALLLPSSF